MLSSQEELSISTSIETELNETGNDKLFLKKSYTRKWKLKNNKNDLEKTCSNNTVDKEEEETLPKLRVRDMVDRFNREAEAAYMHPMPFTHYSAKRVERKPLGQTTVSKTSISSITEQQPKRKQELSLKTADTHKEILQHCSDRTIVASPTSSSIKKDMKELESDLKMISVSEPTNDPIVDESNLEAAYQSRTTIAKTDNGVRIVIDIYFDEVDANNYIGSRIETAVPKSQILNEFQKTAATSSAKKVDWIKNQDP